MPTERALRGSTLPVRCRAARTGAAILCLILTLAAPGCGPERYATLRKTPQNPLENQLQFTAIKGLQPSERTMQVLRRFGLEQQLHGDGRDLYEQLEAFHEREPIPETHYACAEVAYLAARRAATGDQKQALDLYGATLVHAHQFLFDPGLSRNVYDPEFRGACNLYNQALESALRIVLKQNALRPGASLQLETATRHFDVEIVERSNAWKNEDFARLEFASDYEVKGLTNQYRGYGLGVPLIAVRNCRDESDPREKFYPPDLSFPVTVFLRFEVVPARGEAMPGGSHRCLLEFYDPLSTADIDIAGTRVPLESDLTTPLAYFLDKPSLAELPTLGFVNPDKYQGLEGLYMVQPYQPGKIPVLMVHGLWSSPITWMEMFNDLRSAKEIRDHYQFWFYLYPTGQPFWVSASQMRRDLAQARVLLDPSRHEPALDHLVLVGHSMGGLVSKLQSFSSGDAVWHTVSKQPIQLVKADGDVRDNLEHVYFFQANPAVRRIITIGTPHRGSKFANDFTRFAAHKLVTVPQAMIRGTQEIYRENPGAFDAGSLLNITTSIDSLAPNCPLLPVMLAAPRAPWMHHHNIVGVIEDKALVRRVAGRGDGIVEYDSAHLDNVDSEKVVPADHLHVHRHPLAVLEVRRILRQHLAEIQAWPRRPDAGPPHPRVYQASAEIAPRPAAAETR
ncbi:MAG: hypothetical protein K2Y37_20350 [Pirellulales bacterium]|nr:hypothetical protein [Pirellulales bacterium]